MSATSVGKDVRAILAGGGFRRLLAARLTSQVADGWFQAGLAGSVLFSPERQASAVAIAAGFAVLLVPYSVLGPFVGVFLDRWDRRASMSAANLIRAAFVVPTAALVWLDLTGPGFAACALVVIAANRFFLAGLGAALPHVVDDARLVTANSIATTAGTVGFAAGLGTSALLLATPFVASDRHGYAVIAILGSVGYLVSAMLLRVLFRRGTLGPDETEQRSDTVVAALVDVARGMVDGVRHLARRRAAGYAVLVQAGHRALFGVLSLAILLLFSRYFTTDSDRSISGLGLVVLAGGIGVLLAAVITPAATRRLSGRAYIGLLLGGAGLTLLAVAPPFRAPLLLVGVLLLNFASQGTKIVVDATLQHECEDSFRGRVFSLNDTAVNATFVAGLFVAATTLPPNGRSPAAVVLISIGYGVLAVWYVAAGRRWISRRGRGRAPSGTAQPPPRPGTADHARAGSP